jgi:hypothetical protein
MTDPWHIALAGSARRDLALNLERDVLGRLAGHDWVPYTELLALAPGDHEIVIPELEGEESFGADYAHGGAYATGPSGKPDGRMLEDLIQHLRGQALVDEGYPAGAGRSVRLYDDDEPAGMTEIASRLGVKRETVEQWQFRKLLPDPLPGTVGGRPAWRWGVIRAWAGETGRLPGSPKPYVRKGPVPPKPGEPKYAPWRVGAEHPDTPL